MLRSTLARAVSSAAVAIMIFLGGGLVSVQAAELTPVQVQAVITLLESFKADPAAIRAVTAALAAPVVAPDGHLDCSLDTNLGVGASGSQVVTLQHMLKLDGEAVTITGTFDPQTVAAVKAYQAKHVAEILTPNGLTAPTGYVGPATRARLNHSIVLCIPGGVASTATTTPRVYTLAAVGGTLDYTEDRRLDQNDTEYLLEVAVGSKTCPVGKDCDLNNDGRVAASDALVLANYVGSPAKVGQLDYNEDYKVDALDLTFLQKIAMGSLICPVGRVCELDADSGVTAADALTLADYIGK